MFKRLSVASSRHLFIVAAFVFISTVVLRTWNITEIFELLGDQVLYWNIALRPWRELPLGGGPSSVGGTTIGPAFIWTMWGIRHVVGPWTSNLPHAGGIGLSIVQSAADAMIAVAIWKRFGSLALALAITLLIATAPEDMSLSASIWNPPLAVAFVKMSIGCVLLADGARSLWWTAGATAAAILAVQSHSSAVFFAAPVILSLTGRELLAGRRRRAVQVACITVMTVLMLEAPYLLDLATNRSKQTRPAVVVANVLSTIEHPETLRPRAAFAALVDASHAIFVRPWSFTPLGVPLAVCALLAAFRARHDLALVGVTIAPLVAAIAGFSFWQGAFEFYWFMTLMPSIALMIGIAVTAWQPAAPAAAGLLLLLVLAAQPARFAHSQSINRLPTYGALVRGSQEIRRRAGEIARIDIEFPVEPSTNTHFVYERVLGGRVTPSSAVHRHDRTNRPGALRSGPCRRRQGPARVMDLKEVGQLGADEGSHWYYASKARALRALSRQLPSRTDSRRRRRIWFLFEDPPSGDGGKKRDLRRPGVSN